MVCSGLGLFMQGFLMFLTINYEQGHFKLRNPHDPLEFFNHQCAKYI